MEIPTENYRKLIVQTQKSNQILISTLNEFYSNEQVLNSTKTLGTLVNMIEYNQNDYQNILHNMQSAMQMVSSFPKEYLNNSIETLGTLTNIIKNNQSYYQNISTIISSANDMFSTIHIKNSKELSYQYYFNIRLEESDNKLLFVLKEIYETKNFELMSSMDQLNYFYTFQHLLKTYRPFIIIFMNIFLILIKKNSTNNIMLEIVFELININLFLDTCIKKIDKKIDILENQKYLN